MRSFEVTHTIAGREATELLNADDSAGAIRRCLELHNVHPTRVVPADGPHATGGPYDEEIAEMRAEIRKAYPRASETVVCDGVWLKTDDGRFIRIGETLAEAADVAREDGHRARSIRREIERVGGDRIS